MILGTWLQRSVVPELSGSKGEECPKDMGVKEFTLKI